MSNITLNEQLRAILTSKWMTGTLAGPGPPADRSRLQARGIIPRNDGFCLGNHPADWPCTGTHPHTPVDHTCFVNNTPKGA